MGKRNLKKYKHKINLNDKDNNDIDDFSDVESLKDLQTILNALQSGDAETREHITNFLSIHQFNIEDKNLIEIISSIPFIKTLTNM